MSLTIKQAFAALSDACANGMKNPFFVMRRLKESFADVADKVVDAGGDKVTVTPITDSGTKIAEIKVNNTTSELYAPKAQVTQTVQSGTEIADIDGTKIYAPTGGGSIDYSTAEQDTGIKWIDGRHIYVRTIENLNISGTFNNLLNMPGTYTWLREVVGLAIGRSQNAYGITISYPVCVLYDYNSQGMQVMPYNKSINDAGYQMKWLTVYYVKAQ